MRPARPSAWSRASLCKTSRFVMHPTPCKACRASPSADRARRTISPSCASAAPKAITRSSLSMASRSTRRQPTASSISPVSTPTRSSRSRCCAGPQSGLYGNGAIGGVVNIITKSGKGPLTFRARGEGGAFGTRDGALQVSGGSDDLYGSLTLQGRTTDGFNISTSGNEDDGGGFRPSRFAAAPPSSTT